MQKRRMEMVGVPHGLAFFTMAAFGAEADLYNMPPSARPFDALPTALAALA